MADLIRKIMTCEPKEVSDRVLQFVGSNETQDRDREVILADGWDIKNYKKNPIFMWAHRYADPPIGKAQKVWVDKETKELKFNIEFAPPETYEFADTIFKLYKGGFLRATSVGFMPKEWSDGDGDKAPRTTFSKQELLELSGVPVPSNPDALEVAREAGAITVKEFKACQNEWYETEVTKPEEDDDWISIPVRECKITATIDISKKEGIQALYCGKEKQVHTYKFDKRDPYNWTMAKAKKWVEDHKSVEGIDEDEGIEIEEKVVSQSEIKDEFDYLKGIIEDVGLNEEAMEDAWELMRDIMRLAGDDIPDDIRDTIGVIITGQQELKVRDAINYLEEYLAKTNVPEQAPKPEELNDDKKEVKAPSMQEIAEMVAGAVKDEIGRLRGKVS